jgi:hypothetical protein
MVVDLELLEVARVPSGRLLETWYRYRYCAHEIAT